MCPWVREKNRIDKLCARLKACEKADHSQTIINAISVGGAFHARECRLAVAVWKIAVKRR
jgi:hypothetical protein